MEGYAIYLVKKNIHLFIGWWHIGAIESSSWFIEFSESIEYFYYDSIKHWSESSKSWKRRSAYISRSIRIKGAICYKSHVEYYTDVAFMAIATLHAPRVPLTTCSWPRVPPGATAAVSVARLHGTRGGVPGTRKGVEGGDVFRDAGSCWGAALGWVLDSGPGGNRLCLASCEGPLVISVR